MLPLVVATPGGSGSFSMLENLNCIGHEVNDETRDGERFIGTVKAGATSSVAMVSLMATTIREGCHRDDVPMPQRASTMSCALSSGSMNGPR